MMVRKKRMVSGKCYEIFSKDNRSVILFLDKHLSNYLCKYMFSATDSAFDNENVWTNQSNQYFWLGIEEKEEGNI